MDQLKTAIREKGIAVEELRQYSYDTNRNQTDIKNTKTGEDQTYVYDVENRLSQVSVTKDGKTAVIQQNIYNGEGQRIQKVDGDETTNYYYQNGVVAYTTDANGEQNSQNLIGTDGNVLATERFQHMETYESYSKKLKQVKSLPKGYDVTCGNITVKLGLSAHNKLQKQILEEFVPNFASGSELLYIGDTSDRTLQRDDKRLSELGIKILEDTSKLPDIILYDSDKNRIIYVEAYSSTGEFNKDRVDYINTYCSYKNDIEVAFVTAFATTKKMLQVYPKIAWDTEIWIAEEATHLTHKNGDRFMGRSPEEFL